MRSFQEERRLSEVRRYDILDTPPDGAFDRITSIAARLVDTPISVISIVDSDRIWFKSHHGLLVDQVDRTPGLCASVIIQDKALVISDALLDLEALANPLVAGEFGLRFYAGVPLTTSAGFNLGTLCVIDKIPRVLSSNQVALLEELAKVVIDELELRLSARSAIAKLEAEVRTDFLTGLPNRRHLHDWLISPIGHSRRGRGPFCLAMIDIDHFKSINDTFGHGIGDQTIKQVAAFIQNFLSSADFVIRLGGDEFVVVITGSIDQACEILTNMRMDLANESFEAIPISIRISIGVTELRLSDEGDKAIGRADAALYHAKKNGRDQITVFEEGPVI